MAGHPPSATRATWIVLFGALTMSLFVLALVGLASKVPLDAREAGLGLTISAAMLIGSAVFTVLRVKPRSVVGAEPDLPEPARWQSDSLVALAMSEAATIFAFVMLGGDKTLFLAVCGASLLVNVVLVLPAGLAYWSAWEARTRR